MKTPFKHHENLQKPKTHPWGYDWFCWEFQFTTGHIEFIIYVGDDDKLFYGDAHPSLQVYGKQPQIGWEGAPTKHQ